MAIHLKASAFLCRIVVAVIISQVCAMSPASAQSQEFAAGLRRVEALASLKKESAVTHELSLEFMQFAGSYSNAKSLVSGLHKPSEIILVSMKTGNDTSLGVPSRNMAYGDIYRVLFVARDFVKQQKIASPNPEQIGQALNVAFLRTSSSAANGRSEDGNAPKGEKNSTTSAQPEADTKNKNPRPGNGGGQRASTESSGATAVKPSESGQSSANPPSGTSQGGSKFGSGNSNGITNGGTTGGGAKTIFGGATDGVGRDCPPSCAGAGTSQGVSGNPRGVPGETALIITPDTHGQTPLLPAMSPANGVPNASFSVTATSPVTAPAPNVTGPSPNVTAAPSPNVTAAPSPNVTAAPAPNVTAAPAPNFTAAPAPNFTAAPALNIIVPGRVFVPQIPNIPRGQFRQ